MLVKYNQIGIHYIELLTHTKSIVNPLQPDKLINKKFEKLKLTRDSITFIPGEIDEKTQRLEAGIHEVTEDEWTVISHHAKHLIDKGILSVIEIKNKEGKLVPINSLSDLPLKEAIAVVGQCFDVVTLKKWKRDKRSDVRLFVNNQLEKILSKENKLNELDVDDYDEIDEAIGE